MKINENKLFISGLSKTLLAS